MKLRMIVVLALVLNGAVLQAQTTQEPIHKSREFLRWKFEQGGKELKFNELYQVLSSNSNAVRELNVASNYHKVGSLFSLFGGFMLGYGLADAMSGRTVNSSVLIAGGAGSVLAYAFNKTYQRHAALAVDLFNMKPSTSARMTSEVLVGPGGVSLIFKF